MRRHRYIKLFFYALLLEKRSFQYLAMGAGDTYGRVIGVVLDSSGKA